MTKKREITADSRKMVGFFNNHIKELDDKIRPLVKRRRKAVIARNLAREGLI